MFLTSTAYISLYRYWKLQGHIMVKGFNKGHEILLNCAKTTSNTKTWKHGNIKALIYRWEIFRKSWFYPKFINTITRIFYFIFIIHYTFLKNLIFLFKLLQHFTTILHQIWLTNSSGHKNSHFIKAFKPLAFWAHSNLQYLLGRLNGEKDYDSYLPSFITSHP